LGEEIAVEANPNSQVLLGEELMVNADADIISFGAGYSNLKCLHVWE
jgi:hypothetical protein